MNQHKIIKSGNSHAVTLPAGLVKALGLKAGDLVDVVVSLDQSQITYQFNAPRQLSLVPGVKPLKSSTNLTLTN